MKLRDKNPPQKSIQSTLEKNEHGGNEKELKNEANEQTEIVLKGAFGDRPWEGCVNSEVYRVPRGVRVRVPAFLAEHIRRTEAERERAEAVSSLLARAAKVN